MPVLLIAALLYVANGSTTTTTTVHNAEEDPTTTANGGADTMLQPVQASVQENPAVVGGDVGYLMQLAAQVAALSEAIQAQKESIRDLKAEARDKDADVRRLTEEVHAQNEKIHAQDIALRDQQQQLAALQRAMSDAESNFAGKLASLSKKPHGCDVSIKMFDDVEGRVEGNEQDGVISRARMDKLEKILEDLLKSFTWFQQQSDGRVSEVIDSHKSLAKKHNKLASNHDGLHREVAERHSDLQQELKMMRAPLSSGAGKARNSSNRSGAFQGNATTNASREPITAEQRRELMATARAAGVAMYVLANSNLLNIGGGCNVEEDLVVQGDLTVYGKIYSADAAVYGLPTSTPTASPTPAPTVVRDPDHEFDFRGCTDGMVVVDPYDASINATAKNGATCSEEGMALDGVDDFIDFTTWAFGGATTVEMLVQYSSLNGEGALLHFGYSTSSADSFVMHSTSYLAAVINGKFFCPYDTLFWYEGC